MYCNEAIKKVHTSQREVQFLPVAPQHSNVVVQKLFYFYIFVYVVGDVLFLNFFFVSDYFVFVANGTEESKFCNIVKLTN